METIVYNEETWFTGRNGIFQQTGMVVIHDKDVVKLKPTTRKGKIGECLQEIPLEHIPELIGHLSNIYRKKLQSDRESRISSASDEELITELESRNLLTLK